jgi:hypothetical protein
VRRHRAEQTGGRRRRHRTAIRRTRQVLGRPADR